MKHGTISGYRHHRCRCFECRAAKAAYYRAYRARLSAEQGTWVPRVGTVRRLRALAADGWTTGAIATAAYTGHNAVWHLQHRQAGKGMILATTAAAWADVYEQLWWQTPQPSRESSYAANCAARKGWPASWQWEGIDIDDPDATPHPADAAVIDDVLVERIMRGDSVPQPYSRSPERVEAVRRLAGRGYNDADIGRRIGITGSGVARIRVRNNIPPGQPKENAA